MTDAEYKAFWENVRKCSEEVANWPEWQKAACKLAVNGHPAYNNEEVPHGQ